MHERCIRDDWHAASQLRNKGFISLEPTCLHCFYERHRSWPWWQACLSNGIGIYKAKLRDFTAISVRLDERLAAWIFSPWLAGETPEGWRWMTKQQKPQLRCNVVSEFSWESSIMAQTEKKPKDKKDKEKKATYYVHHCTEVWFVDCR